MSIVNFEHVIAGWAGVLDAVQFFPLINLTMRNKGVFRLQFLQKVLHHMGQGIQERTK